MTVTLILTSFRVGDAGNRCLKVWTGNHDHSPSTRTDSEDSMKVEGASPGINDRGIRSRSGKGMWWPLSIASITQGDEKGIAI